MVSKNRLHLRDNSNIIKIWENTPISDIIRHVDVKAELENFEWGFNTKWTHNKLIAASPFRYDASPSFFVNLIDNGYGAGSWADSGAYDADYASGDFVKLLSFLRNETREETVEYLAELYLPEYREITKLSPRQIRRKAQPIYLDESQFERVVSPYLLSRGISAATQQKAGILYNPQHKGFCAFAWRDRQGRLCNVKYRATRGKLFFYERNATPIRDLIYGAESVVIDAGPLIICEAEIDRLSWVEAGYQAVAVGGIAVSKRKIEILRSLPAKQFIIAGDNDKAGRRFEQRLYDALCGLDRKIAVKLYPHKDANDILKTPQSKKALRRIVEVTLRSSTLNQSALTIHRK